MFSLTAEQVALNPYIEKSRGSESTAPVCPSSDPDLSGCEVAAKTEQGYVCGRKRKANRGICYASFRGIRYAKPPLGDLRFKQLLPAECLNGVFNATEEGPICPQVDIFYGPLMTPSVMSEDCIRINIHVPCIYNADTEEKSAVLVIFHGGSYSFGSGNSDVYGPEYLVTKNITVVSFNYRLNVFGYFSQNNEYFPGNNGLRDSIAALQWVQKNIKNFGGDPDRVTIMGQSAGATMVHVLSLSPAAKGLFKQVIAMSGLAITSGYSFSPDYMKDLNLLFLAKMGINPLSSPKEIHDKLVNASVSEILEANEYIQGLNGIAGLVPTVEKPHANFTMVLPKDPEVLISEGVGKEYPLMIGFTDNEFIVFKKNMEDANLETKLKALPYLAVPANLVYAVGPLTLGVLTAKQWAKYFDVAFLTLNKFIVAQNDGSYTYVAQRLALQRLAVGAEKTYIYRFAYPGDDSPIKKTKGLTFKGAGHAEDLSYCCRFGSYLGPITDLDEFSNSTNDGKMKELMTSAMANFVKMGSPALNDLDWPPTGLDLGYQLLATPEYNFTTADPYYKNGAKEHFDEMYRIAHEKIVPQVPLL